MDYVPKIIALRDEIEQIVDCGCCTLDGQTLLRLARWWRELHPDLRGVPEKDHEVIDGCTTTLSGYDAINQQGERQPVTTPTGTPEERPNTALSPEEQLLRIRDQASRYLTARYGPNVWFKAPEVFSNVLERWIRYVCSADPAALELAEGAMQQIERMAAEQRDAAT